MLEAMLDVPERPMVVAMINIEVFSRQNQVH